MIKNDFNGAVDRALDPHIDRARDASLPDDERNAAVVAALAESGQFYADHATLSSRADLAAMSAEDLQAHFAPALEQLLADYADKRGGTVVATLGPKAHRSLVDAYWSRIRELCMQPQRGFA